MDKTREAIKVLEDFSGTAYVDARGKSTGFGHYIKKGEEGLLNRELSREEAEALLTKDIDSHQAGMREWGKRPMSDQQKAAVTSLAYNTGAKSGAVKQVMDLYNKGKDAEAAAVFGRYNRSYNPKTGSKDVNPALVKRREFESRLFLAKDDVDIKELHDETHGRKARTSTMNIASGPAGPRPGARETAMAGNKSVYAQLQDLNLNLGEASHGNSEFMQRLRREGGSV